MNRREDGRLDPARIGGPGAAVGDTLVWDGMRWVPTPAGVPVGGFYRDRFPTSTGTLPAAPLLATLTLTPLPSSLHLYVNGVELDEGTDYTLSGPTITFTSGAVPAGSVLNARYAFESGTTSGTPGYETMLCEHFTRADSTSSIGGAGWVVHGGVWGITSNRAYLVSTTGGTTINSLSLVRRDTGASSVTLRVQNYRTTSSGLSGLLFGYNPTANSGYLMNFDSSAGSGTVYLQKITGGSLSQLTPFSSSQTSWTGVSGGAELQVVWNASTGTVVATKDGVTIQTWTDGSPYTGGTWVGMGSNTPGLSGGDTWDEFCWGA